MLAMELVLRYLVTVKPLIRDLLRHHANTLVASDRSTRDKTIGPRVSLVQRSHCITMWLSLFLK